jgi:predicted porin
VDAALAWDRNGEDRKTVGAYGSYNFGVVKLWGQFEKGDIAPTGNIVNGIGVGRPSRPGVTSVKRYSFSVSAPIGVAVLKAGYGHYDEEQVNKVALGADYFLSKRTNLYANMAKLSGDNTTLTDANRKVRFDAGIWHRF